MSTARYHQVPVGELSAWLRTQKDSWWSVDGDTILTRRLSFPCPSQKLAAALDRQAGTVQVLDAEAKFPGPKLTAGELETLASDGEGRVLQLRWTEDGRDWLLVEDREAAELSRQDVAAERK